MFSMSVRDNIRFGVTHAHWDDVSATADPAGATEFIRYLDYRFATPIDRHELSGGQIQRIYVVRAMILRSLVLLFDTVNESVVQEALERCEEGRTRIIVAHRLATVARAAQILVRNSSRLRPGYTADLSHPSSIIEAARRTSKRPRPSSSSFSRSRPRSTPRDSHNMNI
jgi:ATP-binding cassette subfamily B protein